MVQVHIKGNFKKKAGWTTLPFNILIGDMSFVGPRPDVSLQQLRK
jgi:lipopolysaccharide/colanic/teichoic acid biosynthesis glycosyltransferase